MPDRLASTLHETFGFSDFKPGQRAIVEALMGGDNLLAVMPTGGGKSLCYQLPALLKPGLTLVVSPLIALMDNQVTQLQGLGVAAAAVHSGKSRAEKAATWDLMRQGTLKLLYLSPELLATERLLAALKRLGVAQVIVDEAHCISQWGHDFRPEYRALGELARGFPEAVIAGFTATADAATRDDIVRQLMDGRKGRVFVHGFDRPNIRLSVVEKAGADRQILDLLEGWRGRQGIVYRLSRKNTEATAALLQGAGHRAVAYHAGLDGTTRRRLLDRFLTEPGLVVVATIAFGMGIDKPDIRYVVHMDLPGNLEAYYQEIGRAGRDGGPAEAVLLYGLDDIRRRRLLIDGTEAAESVRRVNYRRLEALLAFAETPGCRRQALLGYFGERPPPCGNCDRCLDPPELADATPAAQAVLRAIEATGARFGQAHLVDVLRGQATAKAAQHGHDRLPVFGALREMEAPQLRALMRQLYARAIVDIDIAGHGSLRPGPGADAVANGEAEVALDLRQRAKPPKARTRSSAQGTAPPPASPLNPTEDGLLQALKSLRLTIARRIEKPAYIVFNDATLVDMARKRPHTVEEFGTVQGVGAAKRDLYAEAFLAAIASHAGA
ncbi:MAG: DNA helicase RecQ [Geminicoccaceae bacterium]|nr:DNA helicase RecQ [Geminicoccaceae bacterium]